VVRSGGFAGLRLERELETDRLPAAQRAEIERLVFEARFFELPAHAMSGLPDVMHYRIRVERSDGSHEVTTDDRSASEPLCALAERILKG
jgi:hypothetical protein